VPRYGRISDTVWPTLFRDPLRATDGAQTLRVMKGMSLVLVIQLQHRQQVERLETSDTRAHDDESRAQALDLRMGVCARIQ
jgi:hypothetical protein